MAELSGIRCLLHSLAVGVSIMRLTEGCLCVGECISALCECIRTVCVRAPSECVFSKCTIISSVCQFSMVTKGGYSSYSPMAARDVLKPANTLGHSYAHTHRAPTQQTVPCVVTVYLMNWVLCVIFLHCAECLSRRRWSQLSAKKCVLINADKVTLDKKEINKNSSICIPRNQIGPWIN